MNNILRFYLVMINGICFILFGLDKWLAINHKYRIPEKYLFLFSILGGSFGSILGMFLFRHKTKKIKFYLGIPIIFLIQIFLFSI